MNTQKRNFDLSGEGFEAGTVAIDNILCAILFKYNDYTGKGWFTAMQ